MFDWIKNKYKAVMKVVWKKKDPLMDACDTFYKNENFKSLVKDLDLELDEVSIIQSSPTEPKK